MKQIIQEILNTSIQVKKESIETHIQSLEKCAQKMSECLTSGHKILIFGNGGSAADAQHIAAEFVNRFQIERPPLAAIALTTDTSILTSIGNDYDFNDIFLKQIKAIGKKHDIAWGISTSGNSANVVAALSVAKEMGLTTIGMTGEGGGKTAGHSDILLPVNSRITARIQETHITMAHILCDLVDRILFP
ncbi:MAG: phosphoheptose isomerase [Candidatus Magnetoglobus multicellularis str. Araruama]|uniref:Phosphoheptose isomerase n=1 Tax=Candidatus Magnetoglobus multicellularis str. Araruama TaxID=890399 RepID=A0A1V1P8U2_9BACT|nr:MAG: phosphoheptose isomerase [Candidatus Magnetoglobus multicellularis str. Araruama]